MATASHAPAHLPPLGSHERGEIGIQLQETLVDLADLALVGKQLHWCIVGPGFMPLHRHLDELVDSWHGLSDAVAERAVALGEFPDGQASAIAAHDGYRNIARGPIEDHAVVAELVRRLAEVDEKTRTRMDRLGEIDAASQDVLVDVVRALEEQLWMLRSHMPLSGRPAADGASPRA
ncbi:MAG: starvation-inducible DNA-binding protein [Solirubrobacteraceae bacterium]|jgi:starvation-inducible DNA-binding protein|nr:starvation-inducible DNA-binding protein [Solirubrobacteraceae bacterium]